MKEKNIVITGSSRGIGFGLAREFALLGHRVTLNSRSEENLSFAKEQIIKITGNSKVAAVRGDMSVYHDVVELLRQSTEHFGPVDIWINNAGVPQPLLPFVSVTPEEYEKVIRVNILGSLYGSRVALQHFNTRHRGTLVQMLGFGSNGKVMNNMVLYGMSKNALAYFIRGLTKEIKGSGIQLITMNPGMVITDFLLKHNYTNQEERQKAIRIFNILAEKEETVTPWLVKKILKNKKEVQNIRWLNGFKAMHHFLVRPISRRKIVSEDQIPNLSI